MTAREKEKKNLSPQRRRGKVQHRCCLFRTFRGWKKWTFTSTQSVGFWETCLHSDGSRLSCSSELRGNTRECWPPEVCHLQVKVRITGQSTWILCDAKFSIKQNSLNFFSFSHVLFSKDFFLVLPFSEWACLFAVLCLKCKAGGGLNLYHLKCHCYFCVLRSVLLCIWTRV